MRTPKLRRQRAKGRPDRAFIELRGQRLYLGPWGTSDTGLAYARAISEIASAGEPAKIDENAHAVTMGRVVVRYLELERRRLADATGTPGPRWTKARLACRPVWDLHRGTRAVEFGPRALMACRARMLAIGCVETDDDGEPINGPKPCGRGWANAQTGRVLRMIRWAVSVEMIPATVYARCAALAPLQAGEATDGPPVLPVSDDAIAATLAHLPTPLATLVRLQRLTGARPGELVTMTPGDIDTDTPIWVYRPRCHKTAHHGRDRAIYLGPRCIALLTPLMGRDPAAPLFSPREAMRERHATCAHKRAQPPARPQTGRQHGTAYTVASYRRAITRACARAGVPSWTPHQIRHTVATELRAAGGIELAKAVLGHSSVTATTVYAERDLAAARRSAETRG